MRRLQLAPGSPVPEARAYHSLVAMGTRLLLFGGRGAGGNLMMAEQLAVFDNRTLTWILPGAPSYSIWRKGEVQ